MDTVADFLSQIKNAQAVKKETVKIPFSNLRYRIAEVLAENDFVEEVNKKGRDPNKSIIIDLKYENGEPKIEEMKRVSKPGQRIYKSAGEIEEVRGGYGLGIISTSQGILTDTEARKRHLGGEVLCKVW
ncbi:MAG: 30S ribosomal protein S8 [Candidatus Paceibacterota bacterium]